jgi:hypothetical protein
MKEMAQGLASLHQMARIQGGYAVSTYRMSEQEAISQRTKPLSAMLQESYIIH